MASLRSSLCLHWSSQETFHSLLTNLLVGLGAHSQFRKYSQSQLPLSAGFSQNVLAGARPPGCPRWRACLTLLWFSHEKYLSAKFLTSQSFCSSPLVRPYSLVSRAVSLPHSFPTKLALFLLITQLGCFSFQIKLAISGSKPAGFKASLALTTLCFPWGGERKGIRAQARRPKIPTILIKSSRVTWIKASQCGVYHWFIFRALNSCFWQFCPVCISICFLERFAVFTLSLSEVPSLVFILSLSNCTFVYTLELGYSNIYIYTKNF